MPKSRRASAPQAGWTSTLPPPPIPWARPRACAEPIALPERCAQRRARSASSAPSNASRGGTRPAGTRSAPPGTRPRPADGGSGTATRSSRVMVQPHLQFAEPFEEAPGAGVRQVFSRSRPPLDDSSRHEPHRRRADEPSGSRMVRSCCSRIVASLGLRTTPSRGQCHLEQARRAMARMRDRGGCLGARARGKLHTRPPPASVRHISSSVSSGESTSIGHLLPQDGAEPLAQPMHRDLDRAFVTCSCAATARYEGSSPLSVRYGRSSVAVRPCRAVVFRAQLASARSRHRPPTSCRRRDRACHRRPALLA